MLAMKRQSGDTLVEVLIAIAVFSAIAIGAVSIMNQGVSSAQASLEQNLVRNQIDTQAELLRHYHDVEMSSAQGSGESGSTEWGQIVSTAVAAASDYDAITTFNQCVPSGASGAGIPANAFYIDPESGEVVRNHSRFRQPATFAQVRPNGSDGVTGVSEMVWIEAVYNPTQQNADRLTTTRHYDFHIRACWDSPGVSGGLMKLGTIVRLYAPNE